MSTIFYPVIFILEGCKYMNRQYLYLAPLLLLLAGCVTANMFYVQDNMNKFSSSKKIYIETGEEVVPLSSRLANTLHRASFLTTASRKDADYILIFDYSARFDKNPWVFLSFALTMTDPKSGDVLYALTIEDMKPEPVNSLIQRSVDDMRSRNSRKGIGLIIKGTE